MEATGIPMNFGKFVQMGARGFNLERLFNLSEGVGKEQDRLARRFTDDPLVKGNKNSVVRIDRMLPKYYKIRGWDKNGVPTGKTLKKLGLDFVDLGALKK
jgi:aldehyde:ferredoxin oxidoreductase